MESATILKNISTLCNVDGMEETAVFRLVHQELIPATSMAQETLFVVTQTQWL